MILKFWRGHDSARLERIEDRLQQMFADDAWSYRQAMSALLDEVPATDVGEEIRATDRRVNGAERDIRRELVIHASVHGGIDTPAILVYMSIVKDVERIGDYAKNLFDIAADTGGLRAGANLDELRELRDRVGALIDEVAATFAARDTAQAQRQLRDSDELLDAFDAHVSVLVRGDDQSPDAVARALVQRYLKRIVAHLMNVLSSVVMPVDRLDYFDEDPEDRL